MNRDGLHDASHGGLQALAPLLSLLQPSGQRLDLVLGRLLCCYLHALLCLNKREADCVTIGVHAGTAGDMLADPTVEELWCRIPPIRADHLSAACRELTTMEVIGNVKVVIRQPFRW